MRNYAVYIIPHLISFYNIFYMNYGLHQGGCVVYCSYAVIKEVWKWIMILPSADFARETAAQTVQQALASAAEVLWQGSQKHIFICGKSLAFRGKTALELCSFRAAA